MTMLQNTDESDVSALLFSLPKASNITSTHSSDTHAHRQLFLSNTMFPNQPFSTSQLNWASTPVASGGSLDRGLSAHLSSPNRSSTLVALPRSNSAPRLFHLDRGATPSPSSLGPAPQTTISVGAAQTHYSHRPATVGELHLVHSSKSQSPSSHTPLASRQHSTTGTATATATITIHNATANAFPTHPSPSSSPSSAYATSTAPAIPCFQLPNSSMVSLPLGSLNGISASSSAPNTSPERRQENSTDTTDITRTTPQTKGQGGKTKPRSRRRAHIGITNAIDLHSLKSPREAEESSSCRSAPGLARISVQSVRPPPSKVLDFLYLGAVEDAKDAAFLSAHNITTILNISEEEYWCPQRHIVVHPFVIDDSSTADITPLFVPTRAILDRVRSQYYKIRRQQEEILRRGEEIPLGTPRPPCVLVHCQKGRSRSVAIVTSYLMYRNGWSVDQALKFLRQQRPSVEPNIGFLNALRMFQDSMMSMDKRLRRFHQLSVVVKNITCGGATEERVRSFFEEHIGVVRDVAIHHRHSNDSMKHNSKQSSNTLIPSAPTTGAEEEEEEAAAGTLERTPLGDRVGPPLVSFADHLSQEDGSRSSSTTVSSEMGAESNRASEDIHENGLEGKETKSTATSSSELTLCLVYFACSEDVARAEELASTHPDLLRAALGSEKDIRIKASLKIRSQQRK